jgi:hypothetical protein
MGTEVFKERIGIDVSRWKFASPESLTFPLFQTALTGALHLKTQHNIILIANFGLVQSVTLANFGRSARSTHAKLTIHVEAPSCTQRNTMNYVWSYGCRRNSKCYPLQPLETSQQKLQIEDVIISLKYGASCTVYYPTNKCTTYIYISTVFYWCILILIYFVNCNCVDTRWQSYSTQLHTNNTQNITMKQNTPNKTYVT